MFQLRISVAVVLLAACASHTSPLHGLQGGSPIADANLFAYGLIPNVRFPIDLDSGSDYQFLKSASQVQPFCSAVAIQSDAQENSRDGAGQAVVLLTAAHCVEGLVEPTQTSLYAFNCNHADSSCMAHLITQIVLLTPSEDQSGYDDVPGPSGSQRIRGDLALLYLSMHGSGATPPGYNVSSGTQIAVNGPVIVEGYDSNGAQASLTATVAMQNGVYSGPAGLSQSAASSFDIISSDVEAEAAKLLGRTMAANLPVAYSPVVELTAATGTLVVGNSGGPVLSGGQLVGLTHSQCVANTPECAQGTTLATNLTFYTRAFGNGDWGSYVNGFTVALRGGPGVWIVPGQVSTQFGFLSSDDCSDGSCQLAPTITLETGGCADSSSCFSAFCTTDGQPALDAVNGVDCCSQKGVNGSGGCVAAGSACVPDGQASQASGSDCCAQNGVDASGDCQAPPIPSCTAAGQPAKESGGTDCCSKNGVDQNGNCLGQNPACTADEVSAQTADGSDCCSHSGVDQNGNCLSACTPDEVALATDGPPCCANNGVSASGLCNPTGCTPDGQTAADPTAGSDCCSQNGVSASGACNPA